MTHDEAGEIEVYADQFTTRKEQSHARIACAIVMLARAIDRQSTIVATEIVARAELYALRKRVKDLEADM